MFDTNRVSSRKLTDNFGIPQIETRFLPPIRYPFVVNTLVFATTILKIKQSTHPLPTIISKSNSQPIRCQPLSQNQTVNPSVANHYSQNQTVNPSVANHYLKIKQSTHPLPTTILKIKQSTHPLPTIISKSNSQPIRCQLMIVRYGWNKS